MKTREEMTKELIELKAKAESLTREYNEAYQTEKLADSRKIAAQIDEVVGEYGKIAREIVFNDCRLSANPMLTAVTMLSYVTIAAKDEYEGEDKAKIPVRKIIERAKPIDLRALHSFCAKGKDCDGIGADTKWIYKCEYLNKKLTYRRAEELGVSHAKLKEIDDSYAMAAISREVDMGKNPVSNTQLLKSLQSLVTDMLGTDAEGKEYKVTSHDVNFLVSIYSRKSRTALTVSCANHKNFTSYIAEICHRIVTNKLYDVEFKKEKAKA